MTADAARVLPPRMDTDPELDDAVRCLAPRLLRFGLGRYGDPLLAEEASQDALLALVTRWRRHGAPESPEAFTFAVLRRKLARRKVRNALADSLDALRESFGFEPAGGDDPCRRTEERQELRRVLQSLDHLSPRLRDALLLVAGADLDTRTAARVLGISRSALKMRVKRARERLRREHFALTTEAQEPSHG